MSPHTKSPRGLRAYGLPAACPCQGKCGPCRVASPGTPQLSTERQQWMRRPGAVDTANSGPALSRPAKARFVTIRFRRFAPVRSRSLISAAFGAVCRSAYGGIRMKRSPMAVRVLPTHRTSRVGATNYLQLLSQGAAAPGGELWRAADIYHATGRRQPRYARRTAPPAPATGTAGRSPTKAPAPGPAATAPPRTATGERASSGPATSTRRVSRIPPIENSTSTGSRSPRRGMAGEAAPVPLFDRGDDDRAGRLWRGEDRRTRPWPN